MAICYGIIAFEEYWIRLIFNNDIAICSSQFSVTNMIFKFRSDFDIIIDVLNFIIYHLHIHIQNLLIQII